jgi:hypothetical protein
MTTNPLLTARLYNGLKFLAQVILPAAGTLYFALAGLWNLPNANEVVGTIVAVDAFLGAALHIDTKVYNASDAKYDGNVNVTVDPATSVKTFSLELNGDPQNLDASKELLFKVNPQ